ncbi:MAG: hypothetical protein MUO82_10810 [Candidatus Thermoplasmatota archaeon]|nr:hypothetical protein [Candidatus Thermoplasmatota archaeon]
MDIQIPLKFILGWFLIITITYTVCGYLYTTTYDTNIPVVNAPPKGILETIKDGIGWIFDLVVGFFRVAFFFLPNVPLEITGLMNLIIQPFNVIFLLGIYPIIADLIDKIINFLNAIIPF